MFDIMKIFSTYKINDDSILADKYNRMSLKNDRKICRRLLSPFITSVMLILIFVLLQVAVMMIITGCSSLDNNSRKNGEISKPSTSASTSSPSNQSENEMTQDKSNAHDKNSVDENISDDDSSHKIAGESYEQLNKKYEERFDKEEYNKIDEKHAAEYNEAVDYANSYSSIKPMSREELYERLTTEKGTGFSDGAAGYAINHINVDWQKNALEAAETYNQTLQLSKLCLYDQLVSDSGDRFSPKEAQYAVDNINADWKGNALEAARNYSELLGMSDEEIYERLTSSDGDRFTAEEAQYAIDHL